MEEYKNTEPAVDEIYNPVNDTYLKRSEDGKFTHPKTAEKSYKKNEKTWEAMTPEERQKKKLNSEKKQEQEIVSDIGFLSDPDLPKHIIENYVELRLGETFGELKINDNVLQDQGNKVDAYIEIFDKDGKIVDYVFVDFKSKVGLAGKDKLPMSEKQDFSLFKRQKDGKIIHGSFVSNLSMSDLMIIGLPMTNGKNMTEFTEAFQRGEINNVEMKSYGVNKNFFKEKLLKNILQVDEKDVDTKLWDDAKEMYNAFKDVGFKELYKQTDRGSGFYYEAGFQCFLKKIKLGNGKVKRKYELHREIDKDGFFEYILKFDEDGVLNVSLNVDYGSLIENGILQDLNGGKKDGKGSK